jgi:hypothetical protein
MKIIKLTLISILLCIISANLVLAQCGPVNIGSNSNWSSIGGLTACSSQLTTEGGSYTGNVSIYGTGTFINRIVTVDINLTINGNLVVEKDVTSTMVLRVASGKTLTIVGNLGTNSGLENRNITYEVESGATLIVTGTVYGNESIFQTNDLFAGSGTISAGSVEYGGAFGGEGDAACDGTCPNINVSNCTNGSSEICQNNNTNTCGTNYGGTVSSNQSTCGASIDPSILTLSGYTGTILRWEISTNGGTSWTGINNVSSTYDPATITATTRYRAVVMNTAAGNCVSFSTPAIITIGGPGTAGTISTGASVCVPATGQAYSITALPNAQSYQWTYTGTGVTINNSTTNSVTLDFASNATSGNLTVAGVNGCGTGVSSPARAIAVTATPSITGTTPNARCGTGTVNLQATASAGTPAWYAALTGGSALITNTSYTTGSISTTTTYYVQVTNGGCTSTPRTAVVATVNTVPSISAHPSTAAQSLCQNAAATALSVSAAGSNLTYQWYSNAAASNSGGTLIGGATSNSYTPPTTSLGTTYYYVIVSGTCTPAVTSNVSGAVTVSAVPAITSTLPATRCGSGDMSLQATASLGTINWYAASSGGTSLGTGGVYNTPTLTITTTYYVETVNGGCASTPRTAVVATVNTSPYSVTFDANSSFVIPAGVTKVTVEAWGGGAGGGSGTGERGGGGSGAYSRGTVTVTPSTSYAIRVGAGGGAGQNGGKSVFNGDDGFVLARGGNSTTTATGGIGGADTTDVGVIAVSFDGGNGGNGTNNGGGGGGGGSPTSIANGGNGNNGGGTNGGTGGTGTGTGGTGGSEDGTIPATVGQVPGGGGGGRGDDAGVSNSGGSGRVTITVDNSISYSAASFCKSITSAPVVNFVGASGGTYSAVPSGLSINATTGEINPSLSTAGTYNIYYTVACGIVGDMSVTIYDLPTVSSTATNICIGGTATLSPSSGGTWANNAPTYASLASPTVTGVAPGAASFTFTATATGCTSSVTINVNSDLVRTYNAGSTYVVPPGVTSLTIEAWGAGGGGGSGTGARGGGGGGGYTKGVVAVTAGSSYTVTVGTGGTAGNPGTSVSSFVGNNGTISANPGSSTTTTTGGTGGSRVTGGLVTVSSAGGNGGSAPTSGTNRAGGGGGGSGTTTDNVSGSVGTAGGTSTTVATPGGSGSGLGGNGSAADGNPVATVGGPPGGGGGGRGNNGGTSMSGGAGQVRITIPTPSISYTSASFCASVTSAPASITGMTGGVFSYTVNSGGPTLSINTATGEINPSTSSAGTYTVYYGTACAAQLTSTTFTINALPTASFTASPAASICSSTSVIYTTQASQNTYVWSVPGTAGVDYNITSGGIGSTNSTVTLTWLTTGSKTVTVNYNNTNGCTSATAASSTTTVNPTVSISTQPVASEICSGANTSFSVVAAGTNLNYQWRRWGSDISDNAVYSGSNTATLTLTGATTANAGEFSVYITSTCGNLLSDNIMLVVNTPPTISSHPSSSPVCDGGNYTYSVVALGSNLTYAWREDGTPLSNGGVYSGVGTASLTLTGITTALNGKNYSVVVSNGCLPNATSNNATASVISNVTPLVSISADDNSVCAGTNVTFTASPTHGGTLPAYQWKLNGGNVGTNSSTYSSTSLAQNDQVSCVMTSTSQCVTSPTATSNTVTMTVYAVPSSAVLSGGGIVCVPTSSSIAAAITGGASPYTLTYSPGSVVVNSYTSGANITVSPSGTTTYGLVSVVDANGCAAASLSGSAVVTVNPNNNWTGATDTDWSTASNWGCAVLPTSTTDATIPTGLTNYPEIAAGTTGNARHVIIQSGASIELSDATSSLNVYGDWANAGTFIPNMGTVSFVGTTAQSLANTNSGTESFYNLTVNKTGTLTLNSNVDITAGATVLVQSGTLDVASTKAIKLKSADPDLTAMADNTARLGRVTGTITSTSTFTVERYVASPSYRFPYVSGTRPTPTVFLAPAVKSVTAGQWNDDIDVLYYPTFSTISGYSELNGTGAALQDKINRGWRYVLNDATALTLGKGYMVSVGIDNNDDLISVTGAPQVGNFTTPVTYTATGTQGWNLLGNPYPCEIDWNALHAANSGLLGTSMYIMDPYNSSNNNKSYFVYQAGTGISTDTRPSSARTDANGSFIPSSQGFFVIASSNGNVNFTETMKPASPYSAVYGNFRTEANHGLIRINLTDGTYKDQTIIHFRDDASNGYDNQYDSPSLSGGAVKVASVVEGKQLVINGMESISTANGLPLIVSSGVGFKKFLFPEVTVSNGNYYLFDAYLKKYAKIETGAEYAFEQSTDAGSASSSRFMVVNGAGVVAGNEDYPVLANSAMLLSPNPYVANRDLVLSLQGTHTSEVNVEILTMEGASVHKASYQTTPSEAQSKVHLSDINGLLKSGTYMVKCTLGERSYVQKLVVTK